MFYIFLQRPKHCQYSLCLTITSICILYSLFKTDLISFSNLISCVYFNFKIFYSLFFMSTLKHMRVINFK